MIPFLFREVEKTWATPPKLLHILYNTEILSWEIGWDRGATNTGAKRMEEDTLLMQTVPARVALRHYSQEKMGRGGRGGGWQQTIHDKPENTMSILIICLTGSSLNVQYCNCFFHVFSFFPSAVWATSKAPYDLLPLCCFFYGTQSSIVWHWARSHCAWLMRAHPLSWHIINYFALGRLLLAVLQKRDVSLL